MNSENYLSTYKYLLCFLLEVRIGSKRCRQCFRYMRRKRARYGVGHSLLGRKRPLFRHIEGDTFPSLDTPEKSEKKRRGPVF